MFSVASGVTYERPWTNSGNGLEQLGGGEFFSTKVDPPAQKASAARSGSSLTVKKITLTVGITR